MLNQIVLVGRLTSDPEIIEVEGKKKVNILVAVPRAYKNENGEYDTDYIECVLWNAIATNTAEYCHKGDIIGVKGRIQTEEIISGITTKYNQYIVAEKITFLNSNKGEN